MGAPPFTGQPLWWRNSPDIPPESPLAQAEPHPFVLRTARVSLVTGEVLEEQQTCSVQMHPADPCQGIKILPNVQVSELDDLRYERCCVISSETPLSGAGEAPPSPGWLWMSENGESSSRVSNSISSHQTPGASSCQPCSLSKPHPVLPGMPWRSFVISWGWRASPKEPKFTLLCLPGFWPRRDAGAQPGMGWEGWRGVQSIHQCPPGSHPSWDQWGINEGSSRRDRPGGDTDAGKDHKPWPGVSGMDQRV